MSLCADSTRFRCHCAPTRLLAGGPADPVRTTVAPLRQGRPLVGPAVVERVARRVGPGVLAGLLASRADRVDAGIGTWLEGDGAEGDPAVRCSADALLEPLAPG